MASEDDVVVYDLVVVFGRQQDFGLLPGGGRDISDAFYCGRQM